MTTLVIPNKKRGVYGIFTPPIYGLMSLNKQQKCKLTKLIKKIEAYRCKEEEDIVDFRAWILKDLKEIYDKLYD